MKVGSLVVCVDDVVPNKWVKLKKDNIYTIRDVFIGVKKGIKATGVLLEEITNSKNERTGRELGYDINRFRELDTPKSISIEEILEEPVYA